MQHYSTQQAATWRCEDEQRGRRVAQLWSAKEHFMKRLPLKTSFKRHRPPTTCRVFSSRTLQIKQWQPVDFGFEDISVLNITRTIFTTVYNYFGIKRAGEQSKKKTFSECRTAQGLSVPPHSFHSWPRSRVPPVGTSKGPYRPTHVMLFECTLTKRREETRGGGNSYNGVVQCLPCKADQTRIQLLTENTAQLCRSAIQNNQTPGLSFQMETWPVQTYTDANTTYTRVHNVDMIREHPVV